MDRTTLGSVGLMAAAMSLIPIGDAAGKALTGTHGVHPGLVAFARFAVGAAMVLLILRFRVEGRLYRDPRVWLRAGLIAGGIACILTALRTEPMADTFGAFFIGPLVSYLLAVLFLGERVTRAQTAALLLGFAGVLLIVRPGFGAGAGLWFAVAAGTFYGGFLTASRWIGGVYPPLQLMLSQTVAGTVLLAPLAGPGLADPPAMTAGVAWLLAVSGIASASGNLLLVFAYRQTDATVLAPFVYTQLASATLLGWLVFGDWPDATTALGMGVVVAAGVATLMARRR